MELERAVIQLQRDIEDCRSPSNLRGDRGSRRRRSKILREVKLGTVPRGVRSHCKFEWLGRCHGGPTAAIPPGRRCTQRCFAGSGVSKGGARIFDKVVIRTLQRSGAFGRIQASVSVAVSASEG